jgi:uncharacterized oligopeptide transporter (OPT) family protein
MQDLKTGHLLGAAPKAQFWGQVIGATAGAILSAFIYRLYTALVFSHATGIPPPDQDPSLTFFTSSVYEVPGDLFQVPTAYVWIFTARLVTGKGLPPMAKEWAIGAAVLFGCATILRTLATGSKWRKFVPGGIAVAIGKSRPSDCRYAVSKAKQCFDKACTTCHRSLWLAPLAASLRGTGAMC